MERKKLFAGVLLLLLIAGVPGNSTRAVAKEYTGQFSRARFAQVLPDWQQMNINGFGVPQTKQVSALEVFNGYLYSGTFNPIDSPTGLDGAQIYRSPNGVTWTAVTQPGFGDSHDIAAPAILDFTIFKGYLYAGTGRGNASQIWRTSNGTIWAPMDVTGFSDPENVDVTVLVEYGGKLYAGVTNQASGAQIWSSFSGDNNSWTQVGPEAPGPAASRITGMTEFDGALYAAVESDAPAQIWRSYGGPWSTVVSNGFGDPDTLLTGGMAVFGTQLYAGTGNTVSGAQIWRTSDGTTWNQVNNPGFGDPNNTQIEMVYVFQNQIYAGVQNAVTGLEVWRSSNGLSWEQINPDGFGNIHNTTSNGRNATASFLNQLYAGSSNIVDGGELWRMQLPSTFLDVPVSHRFWREIEAFYDAGITTGCSTNPMKFCPLANVTRGEMAVFIERALGNFAPTPNPSGMFTDVPYPGQPAFFQAFIEEFYNDGITTGCTQSPKKYCPQNPVTRQEMAVFIERALGNFAPTPNPSGMFTDVPYPGQPAFFQAFIEQFYNDGITTGCSRNPLKYCPLNKVTRQEMAVFIVRAFGIPLP